MTDGRVDRRVGAPPGRRRQRGVDRRVHDRPSLRHRRDRAAGCRGAPRSLHPAPTGINPGDTNAFALVSAAICDRVDRISVLESADASGYASPDTQRSVGFASPIDAPNLVARAASGTEVFADAVALMGDAL